MHEQNFFTTCLHITLNVLLFLEIPGRPPIVKMNFVINGKHVVLECKVYARTNVSISWLIHKRQLLPNERKYRFSEMTSELVEGYEMSRFSTKQYYEHKMTVTIRRFSPEDLDLYTCVGSNMHGENSASYNLTGTTISNLSVYYIFLTITTCKAWHLNIMLQAFHTCKC